MTKEINKKKEISQNLSKLEEIVNWFKKQEEIDIEAGLDKLKEAAPILKDLKSRLHKIQNEFEEIKHSLEEDETEEGESESEEESEVDTKDIPF